MEGLSPTPEKSSSFARKLFVEASARYPASVVVQGAATALGCLETRLQAKLLGEDLVSDDNQMTYLYQIANNAHRHLAINVTPESLRNIIKSVFTTAQYMQDQWEPARLHDLTALYPTLRHDPFAARELNQAVTKELGVILTADPSE